MEKMNLVGSPVLFDSVQHTYTLEGHELSGVTPIIKWLFPDTYKGIPQGVLNNAADYGTLIHSKCELADSMGIADNDIVREYLRVTREAGLHVAYSEYLVSDERTVASCIDKVYDDDSLGDIKTTSKVHTLLVTIQLSIYAWLYEMQTGRKANRLYLIWLPKPQYGQAEVKELRRIPAEWCKMTVERYVAGCDPLNSLAELAAMGFAQEPEKQRVKGEVPERWEEVINELITIKRQLDILAEREKEIKSSILASMQTNGEDNWSNDLIQISRRAGSVRESIDSKALKEKMPEVYESFKKVAKVAESLTYKVL